MNLPNFSERKCLPNWVDLPADTSEWEVDYDPLGWAKSHCPSYITNDAVQNQGQYFYRFYFARERDALLFTLRWSS